ncbi:MAG TPA: c-type cytochrome [bacterium]
MKTNQSWRSAVALLIVLSVAACTKKERVENPASLELAAQGKILYEQYECAKCHVGDGETATADIIADSVAPDLTDPFLANDSQFVQVHLRFVDRTAMPPIRLSAKEIRALGHYVAQMHRQKHPSVPEEQADSYCPVCYAPVSSQQATAEKLFVTFRGDKFYFECKDCQTTFRKAPEAFLELLKQYQSNLSVVKIPE